jgi:hypothetical protein
VDNPDRVRVPPEAHEEGVHYIGPLNVAEIVSDLVQIVFDSSAFTRLIEAGRERSCVCGDLG